MEMLRRAMVSKYGLTEPLIKEIGSIMKLMVKVNSHIPTEMSMKVTGKMVKPMVMGFLFIIQVVDTKATGKMTYSMDLELKLGLTVISIRDSIRTVRKTGKDFTIGTMEVIIEAIG